MGHLTSALKPHIGCLMRRDIIGAVVTVQIDIYASLCIANFGKT